MKNISYSVKLLSKHQVLNDLTKIIELDQNSMRYPWSEANWKEILQKK